MLAWLTGRRDSFPSSYNDPAHSRDATYRLPSELGDDARFIATIGATWEPAGRGDQGLVLPYLRAVGEQVTRKFSVLDIADVHDALTMAFGRLRGHEIPEASARLDAVNATLRVEEADREFAQRKSDFNREALLQNDELQSRLARLTTIRDLFLRDSAMAGLWWSEGKPDRILDLAARKDSLDAVVSLFNGTAADRAEADRTGELINVFLTDLGPEYREYLLNQLARVFVSYERPDLADGLRPAG
jgi:hypothetical protein